MDPATLDTIQGAVDRIVRDYSEKVLDREGMRARAAALQAEFDAAVRAVPGFEAANPYLWNVAPAEAIFNLAEWADVDAGDNEPCQKGGGVADRNILYTQYDVIEARRPFELTLEQQGYWRAVAAQGGGNCPIRRAEVANGKFPSYVTLLPY